MKYCNKCVLPDTRPNLELDENDVCNACNSHNLKKEINWAERERKFKEIVETAKRKSKGYDCIIPVSGGKDSTWQVVKCLEYGLNPLTVTWRPLVRTEIGKQNLENLISLGVDHIDYQVNPIVEKKLMYKSFVKYGTTAVSMHMGLYNMQLNFALKLGIPLIVWGENSAFEYGGSGEEKNSFKVSSSWLKKYGAMQGTTPKDWFSEGFTEKELTAYLLPDDDEIEAKDIHAIFLGYFFKWDPEATLKVALKHGFQARKEGPKTGYYNYADIDDEFLSIHHWLKWYKFGFTRLSDNLSLEIRNGRMAREQAIQIIKAKGDETPYEDIEKFCSSLGITKKHFFEEAEKFRNPKIWKKNNGVWLIENFLIPDWVWPKNENY